MLYLFESISPSKSQSIVLLRRGSLLLDTPQPLCPRGAPLLRDGRLWMWPLRKNKTFPPFLKPKLVRALDLAATPEDKIFDGYH
mmetsp:Transcript_15722/g.24887  ORF Transcript_15722/g.24887 Transcript_15722/m.24887 type:complete len:84 (+) Transcript_15722:919-1170(+)